MKKSLVRSSINKACIYYGVDRNDLLGGSRKNSVILARNSLIYYFHKVLGETQEDTSDILNRSPATVCITCQNIDKDKIFNKDRFAKINEFIDQLKNIHTENVLEKIISHLRLRLKTLLYSIYIKL